MDSEQAGERSLIGRSLGHYELRLLLGAGGMGNVYRAHDHKLKRDVAIKLVPPNVAGNPYLMGRLNREAHALAVLNHPHIEAIYSLEEADGIDFLVLELVEGETLAQRLARGRIPLPEALAIARQIADALEAAHSRGVIHRDLKPNNLSVTADGRVKLLDFGLAKRYGAGGHSMSQTTAGLVLGTPGYMSPEQITAGDQIDQRTDIWAFGCLLFELLTGQRAFPATTALATLAAIATGQPSWAALPRGTSPRIRQLISSCLEDDPAQRPASMNVVREKLVEVEAAYGRVPTRQLLRDRRIVISLAALVAVTLVAGGLYALRQRRVTWAYRNALPEVDRLSQEGQYDSAFRLFVAAERVIPGDSRLEALRPFATRTSRLNTEPPGADAYVKGYLATDAEWLYLGRTPIDSATTPPAALRLRFELPGHRALEVMRVTGAPEQSFSLIADRAGPENMVFVDGDAISVFGSRVTIADYWIDRHEVTNRAFKALLDADGYDTPRFWQHAFVAEDGTVLSFADAVRRLTDATGRFAPAAWEVGAYPAGQDDYPVGGVSWYEAAAYCAFVGKQLPTAYHWFRAAGAGGSFTHEIALLSNLGATSVRPVGSTEGISWYGAQDMAGNVREWVHNADGSGYRRLLFGGAWDDPIYLFLHGDASSPWDRNPRNGFRCAMYVEPPAAEALSAVQRAGRDYRTERPVSDDRFEAYRSLYAYVPSELDSRVENVDGRSPHYREETISFRAAYGNERVVAHLFIPKTGQPPYQAVVHFPALHAFINDWDHPYTTRDIEFLVRSGRAVMYPFYKGTYTRKEPGLSQIEQRTRQFKDLARAIDYLETRNDIDGERLAFHGNSLGAMFGPIFTALEKRFRASILLSGGFSPVAEPAIDPVNFVTRSTVPTLMIHGRWDAVRPVETHTEPVFQLLGTPEFQKKLFLADGGHMLPLSVVIRETLDWLDKYLGPVRRTSTGEARPSAENATRKAPTARAMR